ncbi:MAG: CPBP family intramembrane metalloprotease [Oscillospiraceae bacterium]|nr:CPBP family intramembrane metalloprotease [Oscillospiraceae bacterium]
MNKNNKKTILLPFIIIAIGFMVAVVASNIVGAWAFIPLALVYWITIFIVVKPTIKMLTDKFIYPPKHFRYVLLALVPVLFCIISFAWGFQYISGVSLILLWVLFAIINPIAEELFWRGYLFDNLEWAPINKILFTTILFTLSHLMWGVFSITIRSYIMIMPLLIMGITWGYAYHKTKSLKWCIIAHFFVDIMNLSVWVFLNIYVPPII